MIYCTKCLNPNTRPRISFNEEGVCNACQTQTLKVSTDWNERWEKLRLLCEKQKERNKEGPNVIVLIPCEKNLECVHYV